jgi:hypothetical protein
MVDNDPNYLPRGDRSMQALAGLMLVALILLIALPFYALVWR